MKLLRATSGDAIGIPLNSVSFRCLLRAVRALPGASLGEAKQCLNDEAYATFQFKGVTFEVNTPVSDYWIDKPVGCPGEVFEEIVRHLEGFRVRWWDRLG